MPTPFSNTLQAPELDTALLHIKNYKGELAKELKTVLLAIQAKAQSYAALSKKDIDISALPPEGETDKREAHFAILGGLKVVADTLNRLTPTLSIGSLQGKANGLINQFLTKAQKIEAPVPCSKGSKLAVLTTLLEANKLYGHAHVLRTFSGKAVASVMHKALTQHESAFARNWATEAKDLLALLSHGKPLPVATAEAADAEDTPVLVAEPVTTVTREPAERTSPGAEVADEENEPVLVAMPEATLTVKPAESAEAAVPEFGPAMPKLQPADFSEEELAEAEALHLSDSASAHVAGNLHLSGVSLQAHQALLKSIADHPPLKDHNGHQPQPPALRDAIEQGTFLKAAETKVAPLDVKHLAQAAKIERLDTINRAVEKATKPVAEGGLKLKPIEKTRGAEFDLNYWHEELEKEQAEQAEQRRALQARVKEGETFRPAWQKQMKKVHRELLRHRPAVEAAVEADSGWKPAVKRK